MTTSFVFAHTCWNDSDGTLAAPGACRGCDQARENPCLWCGYGHVFPTHNSTAHADNGDPVLLRLAGLHPDGDADAAFDEHFAFDAPYVEATFRPAGGAP